MLIRYPRPLFLRLLSAIILWPALAFALVYLPAQGFGYLSASAIAIAFWEYLRLLVFPRNKTIGWSALLLGSVSALSFLASSLELSIGVAILGSLVLLTLPAVLERPSALERPMDVSLTASALAITGLICIVIPLSFIIAIRNLPGGVKLTGFLFLITWTRDAGAFLVGREIFRERGHVIKSSISPRKTYEGAMGGILATVLVAFLLRDWLCDGCHPLYAMTLGLLIGIIGQVGDLVESMIKRISGVEDSSRLIPGQGGLLDTLDSFIYTTPLVFLFVQLITKYKVS